MNWKLLPNIVDIGANLSINDNIQFSLVCKRYRKLSCSSIFSNLKLFKNGISILDRDWGDKKRKQQLLKVCNELECDLEGKLHLVKCIEFYEGYSNAFATKFFKLFINLKYLKYFINNEMFFALSNTLRYSKNLIKIELSNSLPFGLDLQKLSSYNHKHRAIESLRRLERGYSFHFDHSHQLEKNDPIIQYLTKLTIFNSRILESLNSKFPVLKEIKFNLVNFDPVQATQLINKNPQLQSIIIPAFTMNQGLVDSIFSLKKLEYLKIDSLRDDSHENFTYLLENESIKHLVFNYHCFNQAVFPLLFHCKSLDVLELRPLVPIRDPCSYIEPTQWNTLTIQIPTLYINMISNTGFPIDDFINSDKFSEFRFNRSWIKQSYIEDNHESLLNSGDWKIINNDYSYNNYKFSLIKVELNQEE